MAATIAAYLRERFRPAVFGPAIALQAALAIWIGRAAMSAIPLTCIVVLVTLLVLQFRVWDDLEDRDRDRAAHPERVLVRASPAPFWRVALGLTALNLALITVVSLSVAAWLALLDAGFWVAYRLVRARVTDRTWRFGVLPCKYPAFVWLTAATLSSTTPERVIPAALFMWACACAYEALHDRTARSEVTP